MNAGQAFTLIADFVEADENSKPKVWRILRLANNHAWGKGKWWGMTADFFCKVFREEGPNGKPYILSPTGYDALLGINTDSRSPSVLRDSYFMFHKNGPGDIKGHKYCQWNTDVYDAGHVPVILDINNYGCRSGVMVGVRSLGKPGDDEYVNIQGELEDGRIAISHEFDNKETCNCLQAVESDDAPAIRTVHGVRIKITEKFEYVDNVLFTDITAITKSLTRCQIEIIMVNKKGEGFIISKLNPWDIESKYRKYYVPNGCSDTLHGLFKIGKQPHILDDSQPLIIGNEEALISLSKGIHLTYYKEQVAAGATFLQGGILSLEEEMRETSSPIETPIQVVGMYSGEDIPNIMKYH